MAQVLTVEFFGFLTEELCVVKTANKDVAVKHAECAANGQYLLTYLAQHLKSGQAAVAVQDIPAVTAVLSQLEEQAETTDLKQSQYAQVGPTLFAQADRGHAIIHTLVQQEWGVVLL